MYTLGINAVYHDSSACLVKDGIVIAAAEEERFTRIKHAKRPVPFSTYELPYHAIDYCLRAANIELCDIDHIAYSYDPSLLLGTLGNESHISLPLEPSATPRDERWESSWDPLFLSYIVNSPRQLLDGVPLHLSKRFKKDKIKFKWHFVDHHLSHEASAFFVSPYKDAAVMTLDGRGELATTTYGIGKDMVYERIGQVNMPHSLGLLYEDVTHYLGFLHSSDEYKVMALASFGKPKYLQEFRQIVRIEENGQYFIEPNQLELRFGPARAPGCEITTHHFNIASSLQAVLEETVLHLSDWLYNKTDLKSLCMAGGVALNCVMNGRLKENGPFKDIWVQPAAGDAGTALGAAMWIDIQQREPESRSYIMKHAYLGPEYTDTEIESLLRWSKLPYRRWSNVVERTADLLAQNKIIGWFQGRMEFGPRALGARSILASPATEEMQQRLNDIKGREEFRPVAPIILEEEAPKWFVGCERSPFMLFVHNVQTQQIPLIPSAVHVDGTARVQTVNAEQNPHLYELIKAFHARSGIPILINTSFNTRSEPVVCSPRDAIECFWTSPLDALVIGSFILEKTGISHDRTNISSSAHIQTTTYA